MRVGELEKIGEGREAEIFAWEPGTVLRLFRDAAAGERAAREVTVLKAVRSALDVAPEVRGGLEVDGRPGVVMERLEGRNLMEELARRPWRLWELAAMTGRVQAQLHAVQAPSELQALRDKLTEQVRAADVPDGFRDTALGLLDALPDGDRLCHGDYWPANVLLTPRGPVVIDWADATRGDPEGDFARTALMMTLGGLPPGTPALIHLATGLGRQVFDGAYRRAYASRRGCGRQPSPRWVFVRAVSRLAEGVSEERPGLLRELARLQHDLSSGS